MNSEVLYYFKKRAVALVYASGAWFMKVKNSYKAYQAGVSNCRGLINLTSEVMIR